MSRVGESELKRWRDLPAKEILARLADYANEDPTFVAIKDPATVRWYARANEHEFEFLLTGPKFFDTRAKRGGGGAVDLAMHLFDLAFRDAVALLRRRKLFFTDEEFRIDRFPRPGIPFLCDRRMELVAAPNWYLRHIASVRGRTRALPRGVPMVIICSSSSHSWKITGSRGPLSRCRNWLHGAMPCSSAGVGGVLSTSVCAASTSSMRGPSVERSADADPQATP